MISDFDFSVLCCHAWEDSVVLMDIAHVGWLFITWVRYRAGIAGCEF